MNRTLSALSRLETLRKEAKRWLKTIRAGDASAQERLRRAYPGAPAQPGLRDVQHALAREHGAENWSALKTKLEEVALANRSHEERIAEFLEHASLHYGVRPGTTEWDRLYYDHPSRWQYAARILERHPEIASANIHTAAACGNLAEVERILAARPAAALEKGGRESWQPLMFVCMGRLPVPDAEKNGVAIARALLDAGANVLADVGDKPNDCPTITGAIGGGEAGQPPHPQAVALAELLIERGVDPYQPQVLYNTSLGNDDLFWSDFLYDRCAQRNETHKWNGTSEHWPESGVINWLLSYAVSINGIKRAQWALARGADPNRPHFYSKRNLHTEAMRQGHVEIADLLVRSGAVAQPLQGHDAFLAACIRLDWRSATTLAREHPEHLRNAASLMVAATRDLLELATFLLDLGMSPDVADADNRRPLHDAATNDSVRVGLLLIERGAQIDPIEKRYNGTPLSWAVHNKRQHMIDILSPLSRQTATLVNIGKVDRLRELFSAEPALAKETFDGDSLLFYLPEDEDRAIEVAQLLLAHGTDPRVRNKKGMTAAEFFEKLEFDAVADFLGDLSPSGSG
jgi:uncharacterized protein